MHRRGKKRTRIDYEEKPNADTSTFVSEHYGEDASSSRSSFDFPNTEMDLTDKRAGQRDDSENDGSNSGSENSEKVAAKNDASRSHSSHQSQDSEIDSHPELTNALLTINHFRAENNYHTENNTSICESEHSEKGAVTNDASGSHSSNQSQDSEVDSHPELTKALLTTNNSRTENHYHTENNTSICGSEHSERVVITNGAFGSHSSNHSQDSEVDSHPELTNALFTINNSRAKQVGDSENSISTPESEFSKASATTTRHTTRVFGSKSGHVSQDQEDQHKKPIPVYKTRNNKKISKNSQKPRHNLENDSLYLAICNKKVSLTRIVDEWINKYKLGKESALLMLMQFFINASGCKGVISAEMQSQEHVHIIERMSEEFDEETGNNYPLIKIGQPWKKFKSNFCEFIQILVKECQCSIIYDKFLFDNIISLLTGLSDSEVRAFRHTATLAAVKLMTALVDIALDVSVNLHKTQRQCEAEKSKAKEETDELKQLINIKNKLEENLNELKDMLTYMFRSVFGHRYRDTVPEIRAICMTEIGIWMKKFPNGFLDDNYLKYIGWSLHDKVGEVRMKCLQTLQPLYAEKKFQEKLGIFTSKFKDRIIAMTLDRESSVAVQAIKLVTTMYNYHHEVFTDKDCEQIYELVFSSHRAVAQAAGEFLNEKFFTSNEDIDIKFKHNKNYLRNAPFIQDLILFFNESQHFEHGAYLVDSLIETNPMMKDWECMTSILIEEFEEIEKALDEDSLNEKKLQKTLLIEIMVCCIRQAATGETPFGRGPTKKTLSVKESKQIQKDKQHLTEHFIHVLPILLDKYGEDTEKIEKLLAIPQYFELDVLTKSEQKRNLHALLNKIHNIVEKSNHDEILETVSKTLECMCDSESATYQICDKAKSKLADSIAKKYKETITEVENAIDSGEKLTANYIYYVTQTLKKVAIFYSCHNMNNCDTWDSLIRNIKEFRAILSDEATKYCINACFFSILWSQNNLMESTALDKKATEECQKLKSRIGEFMKIMSYLVNTDKDVTISLKEEAYKSICDLLIMFCSHLMSNKNQLLHELVFQADQEMQDMLNKFVQMSVFSEKVDDKNEYSKNEELFNQRNILAAYCKLIIYNMIPTIAAADIFKHYVKFHNDYGDIIKATIGNARDLNKVNCALTMQQSLNILYKEIKKEDEAVGNREGITEIKELAKRFAMFFGPDPAKNREAILSIHQQGIIFALSSQDDAEIELDRPPPNLSYLEILIEFTGKLSKKDKKETLDFLNKNLPTDMTFSKGEDWQPLILYKNSLLYVGQPSGSSERVNTQKKKTHVVEEEENANNGSEKSFFAE